MKDRVEQIREIAVERDQLTELELTGNDEIASVPDDDQGADIGEEKDGGKPCREVAGDVDVFLVELFVLVSISVEFVGLGRERFDDPNAGDVFL